MLYHLAVNGVQREPVPEETLREMIAQGTVGPDALCWREGWADWRPVTAAFGPPVQPKRDPDFFAASPGLTATATPEQEATRRAHLKHEASLRSIGTLYFLGASLLLLLGVASAVAVFLPDSFQAGKEPGVTLLTSGFFIAIGLFQLRVALWLRKLNPKARTPATVLSIIGLLGFPLGTIINIYVLTLLRSSKGEVVLSDYYQKVIAATPHIKYKTSVITWVFVGVLIVAVLAAVIATAVS